MSNITIAVVGLGYVGLPLALEFGKTHKTIGLDTSTNKVKAYLEKRDPTGEMGELEFELSQFFEPTTDFKKLNSADFIIIAVPTPVDETNNPDFSGLISASISVGKNLQKGATVIYESTVYPGATEELCMPILERESGYRWKKDFFLGYSPERINPGDKTHTLTNIIKVVSGDSEDTLDRVSSLYKTIISAGTYEASSIKVAEAAKVIENTQRDLNIALINELAFIFHKIGIDTLEVLEAAETKWNFLPFRPGLVGGHCIGVDPFYLTHKAEEVGYHPQVILSGRRINDSVSQFIGDQTIKHLIKENVLIKGANIIVMGLTFKENCSDVRNSKVIDLINYLNDYGVVTHIYDPVASEEQAFKDFGLRLSSWENLPASAAMIAAVPHQEILELTIENIEEKLLPDGLYVDVKAKLDKEELIKRGYHVWRL